MSSGVKTRYLVRWREGARQRGRRFDRKADAVAFEAYVRREHQVRGAAHVIGKDITLAAWADEWWRDYAEQTLHERTRQNYSYALDLRIVPLLGSMPLKQIKPATIEQWTADLRKRGDGAPSILRASAVLSGIMQRAVVNGLIDSNPVRQVRRPRQQPSRQPDPIAPAVVERIRLQLEQRDAVLISVLAYAGLRPESEALPLTWGDVGERTIAVHATKTNTTRHVRLLKPLADDLKAWRKASGNPYASSLVFPSSGGWTLTDWQNWRRRVWRAAASSAGLSADSRPRDLRASFASLLIAEGRSVVEVAQELGHSPATCLRSYARAFAEQSDKRQTAEQQIVRARNVHAKGAKRSGKRSSGREK